MSDHRLFCYPCLPDEDYVAHLRAVVRETSHDPDYAQEVTPEQSRTFAARAVEARLKILREVYDKEYFTDSYETERLSTKVANQQEFIWFWGVPSAVSALLSSTALDDTPQLGTVSVIDSSDEFGAGFGEICRSGSMSPVGLKPYAVKRILEYVSGSNAALHRRFHTLCLVPRVRRATGGIRGGRSVNTIHRKYIRSRFWGFAPWYVMQGGFLECLEYREVNRRIGHLLAGVAQYPHAHVLSGPEADFIHSLYSMNLPGADLRVTVGPARRGDVRSRFLQRTAPPAAIRQYNHVTFEPVLDGEPGAGLTLSDIERQGAEHACCVVDVDLSDERSLQVQHELWEAGYRLTSIRPARRVEGLSENGSGAIAFPLCGSWAKPNGKWRIAAPYYLESESQDPCEQCIVDYLSALIGFWRSAP